MPKTGKLSTNRLVRTIAVFKLLKCAVLCGLAFGAFKLLNPAISHRLTHWVGSFAWSHNRGFMLSLMTKLTGLTAGQLKELGIGALLYATLFAVEGIGLWFEKKWAEYLTVVATGTLLPIEVYELAKRATLSRGFALLINLVVFIYLVRVVRRETTVQAI